MLGNKNKKRVTYFQECATARTVLKLLLAVLSRIAFDNLCCIILKKTKIIVTEFHECATARKFLKLLLAVLSRIAFGNLCCIIYQSY